MAFDVIKFDREVRELLATLNRGEVAVAASYAHHVSEAMLDGQALGEAFAAAREHSEGARARGCGVSAMRARAIRQRINERAAAALG